MVFIKKYWYIILIIFLIICTTLGIIFLNRKWTNDKVGTENKTSISVVSDKQGLTEENKIDENKVETIENNTEQETTEQEPETTEVENQAVVETSNKNTSTTKSNTQTTKQEQPRVQSESVPAQSNVQEPQEVVQETQVQEQQTNQPVQEPVIPDTPKQDVVEYKENTAMINNIKNAINNNVSEDMQTYGYNIVVDSSIVNLTNQFTFSEKRVADKIKSKFGTIRIYARDYYLNGSYVWTECYVI